MSEFKTAKVYAAEKQGPINIGAGNNDYICKIYGITVEGHLVAVQVSPASYESFCKALLDGSRAEIHCDPSKIISFKQDEKFIRAGMGAVEEAIAATRAKTIEGRQQEPNRRQPGI